MFTATHELAPHPAIALQQKAASRARYARDMVSWPGNPKYVIVHQQGHAVDYTWARQAMGFVSTDYEGQSQ